MRKQNICFLLGLVILTGWLYVSAVVPSLRVQTGQADTTYRSLRQEDESYFSSEEMPFGAEIVNY